MTELRCVLACLLSAMVHMYNATLWQCHQQQQSILGDDINARLEPPS